MAQNHTDANQKTQRWFKPWEYFEGWPFQRLPDDTLGTEYHNNGIVLRVKGDYSDTEMGALLAATDHMWAEGYCSID